MKNLSITLSVLAVSIVAVLGIRYVIPKFNLPDNANPGGIATTTDKVATTTEDVNSGGERTESADALLRSAALKIIDRPISVKIDISDSLRQLATQKIKEASDMIRSNYDYANQWYDLGAYRRMIGDYVGADEAWSFVSRIRPDDSISLHNLGSLYYDLKNYPKAEQYFLASIDKNSKNVDAYIQLAAIYTYNDLSKTSLVEPLLLRGIAANPSESNLMITLGKYYQAKGNLDAARNYFEQALKLNPKNTALQQELELLGK